MTTNGVRRVAVVGATGYAGQELLRLLARHPTVDIALATGSSSTEAARRVPALAGLWDGEVVPFSLEALAGRVDAVFLAVPDTVSARVAPSLAVGGTRVFDLSGAFRLRTRALRERWYPEAAGLWPEAVYGLTEHHRQAITTAALVACPGCYPTAALLSLAPLVEAGLVEGDVIIDAKSGISGAGRTPSERTHFSENHGSVAAYGLFAHRHQAEIEQEVGRHVCFVPHLVPLDRGIFETIYARLAPGVDEDDVSGAFATSYADAPFVRLRGSDPPEIKHVVRTNFCDIGWRVEPGGRQLVLTAVLDNLVKGAAGQAVQNFNVAFGLDERAGLL